MSCGVHAVSDVEHVVGLLRASACEKGPSRQQPQWLAIAGGPGCGKTTLAARVSAKLEARGLRVCVIPMDGYHFYRRELDAMQDPAHAHAKRGAPFTFNATRLVSDLRRARQGLGSGGARFLFPSFDHAAGDPVEDAVALEPGTDVIIVEGLYLLLREAPWCDLLPLFDVRVFLRCAEGEQRRRIVARHMRAWGWNEARAGDRADHNDLPNGRLVTSRSELDPLRVTVVDSTVARAPGVRDPGLQGQRRRTGNQIGRGANALQEPAMLCCEDFQKPLEACWRCIKRRRNERLGEINNTDDHIRVVKELWDRLPFDDSEAEWIGIGINAWAEKWPEVLETVVDADGWDTRFFK
eukprot:g365.t1